MPESLLTILKLLFLLLLYLFFFRVLAAVWAELNPRTPAASPAPATSRTRGPASSPPPSAGSGKGGPTRLRVIEPETAKGQEWPLGDEVTVGRAPGCGVPLTADSTVSQLHARIFRKEGRVLVEDLGSTNGTFLNGKRVSAPVPVRARDRLQVGATVLEVTR